MIVAKERVEECKLPCTTSAKKQGGCGGPPTGAVEAAMGGVGRRRKRPKIGKDKGQPEETGSRERIK